MGRVRPSPTLITKGGYGYSATYRRRSSVRRGTVAIPALTSAPAAEPCSHVGAPVRPGDGGPRQSAGEIEHGESARRWPPWESASESRPAPPTGPTRH